jgi:hypothetical protein
MMGVMLEFLSNTTFFIEKSGMMTMHLPNKNVRQTHILVKKSN